MKVRITCVLCPRRGVYRLVRLAVRFGADARLVDVLHEIAKDCPYERKPWQRPPRKYEARCGARFQDIAGSPRAAADVPAGERAAD
ncbi:hypothetical protein SCD90_09400 [Terrihabitans sp. PJ23]|uniref:Uncharacterized protein n=1 Tax=Terrihabitans rhizophilus TaxID=3092662 RepID=A0ABU4RRM4_9HYPH|nr:hypothetical protein [Terrihabitans sp. PJ23]